MLRQHQHRPNRPPQESRTSGSARGDGESRATPNSTSLLRQHILKRLGSLISAVHRRHRIDNLDAHIDLRLRHGGVGGVEVEFGQQLLRLGREHVVVKPRGGVAARRALCDAR